MPKYHYSDKVRDQVYDQVSSRKKLQTWLPNFMYSKSGLQLCRTNAIWALQGKLFWQKNANPLAADPHAVKWYLNKTAFIWLTIWHHSCNLIINLKMQFTHINSDIQRFIIIITVPCHHGRQLSVLWSPDELFLAHIIFQTCYMQCLLVFCQWCCVIGSISYGYAQNVDIAWWICMWALKSKCLVIHQTINLLTGWCISCSLACIGRIWCIVRNNILSWWRTR